MTLKITESWIKGRVHLSPEKLDDVRSLALPGNYQEKVTHLGTALQNFARLKHLDLSRNALQSLDGLEHLAVLERLNIYYNNIATLKELFRLRHNTSLQEVDLRLNPVTKNEPDYRLFMVHLLPNLRKLDDRSVRESERKAALMHFSSDQAFDLTEHPPMRNQGDTERVVNSRVEMVANMPRKVLDDDECDVLDLIARTGRDLSRPRELTGSSNTTAKVTSHTHKDSSDSSVTTASVMVSNSHEDSSDTSAAAETGPQRTSMITGNLPSTKYPPSPGEEIQANERRRLRNWDEDEDKMSQQQGSHPVKERVKVQFDRGLTLDNRSSIAKDDTVVNGRKSAANRNYIDETQAYTAYTSRGHFTAPPDTKSEFSQESAEIRVKRRGLAFSQEADTDVTTAAASSQSLLNCDDDHPPTRDGTDVNLFLNNFLTLVDRYWNGTKSLHRHGKFQNQAHTLLSTLINEVTTRPPQPTQGTESTTEVLKLRQSLKTTQDHVEQLRTELDAALDERRQLQERLERDSRLPDDTSTDMGMRTGREVERLTRENDNLKVHVKHFNQLQELATMLQESHKSLVTTNDHLLQELDETKQRHLEEVKQLHWSYGELKRTMDLAPAQVAVRGSHN